MWPYSWTHVGTPSHLGHMDRVAATMPSQAHAGAAQEAPNIGQWGGQDVPLVRPSSCIVKGGISSSRRYLPTYLPPKEQADEIERQIQECIDAGLVLEYKDGDYPLHCSPCFLVAKPGSTAKRLVVDYGELNKKALNHSGSIPNMESTLEKIASCRYKTKMDKRSGFWQVDLTPYTQELLAFITPQGRVFKWKVMPFGVANALVYSKS